MEITKSKLEAFLKRLEIQSPYERDEVRFPILPEPGVYQKKMGDPRIIQELKFRYDFQQSDWVLYL